MPQGRDPHGVLWAVPTDGLIVHFRIYCQWSFRIVVVSFDLLSAPSLHNSQTVLFNLDGR